MYKRSVLTGLATLGMACGVAQAQETPYYYAGLGAGQAQIQADEDEDFDANSTAFHLYWGFAVNKYFGMELGYFNTGTADETFDPGEKLEVNMDGAIVSLRGIIPFTDSMGAFVKAGAALYDVDTEAKAGGLSMKVGPNDVEEDLAYGAGFEAVFGGGFGVRIEYQAINNPDADVDMALLSGIYRF
jgi:hypothetical protein